MDEDSDILPRYYVYNFNGSDVVAAKQTEHYSKFGALYNWEAAKKSPPEGWRLPTESDWIELENYVVNHIEGIQSGDYVATDFLVHTSEGGRNSFGFSGILGGCCSEGYFYDRYDYYDPFQWFLDFEGLGSSTSWWSRSVVLWSDYCEDCPIALTMVQHDAYYMSDDFSLDEREPIVGLSIRCIKD